MTISRSIVLLLNIILFPLPISFASEICPADMAFIPEGEFKAGDSYNLHAIFTDPFCIDITEVTQAEYKKLTGKNPSYFKGPRHPVETVSWYQANNYCHNLNKRLPTEWEWEKAAKSRSVTKYFWGNKINSSFLWFADNAEFKTHPVALKIPNFYGLYDISGNVYEWTTSWDSNEKKFKVLRGGSWANRANSVRSAYRDRASPSEYGSEIGFRCVK